MEINSYSDLIGYLVQEKISEGVTNENIQKDISDAIKINPGKSFEIVKGAVKILILEGKENKDIQEIILPIIADNTDEIIYITGAVIQELILKGKKNEEVQEFISKIIKANPNEIFFISNSIIQASVKTTKTNQDLQEFVSTIIKENPSEAYQITDAVIQALVTTTKTNQDLQEFVSTIIKENPSEAYDITDATVRVLLSTNKIIEKDIVEFFLPVIEKNPEKDILIKNIAVLTLMNKSKNIIETYSYFSKLLNGEEELSSLTLFYIISKYIFDKMYDDKKDFKQFENLILELYNKTFKSNKESLANIEIKNVKKLMDKYLDTIFKHKGVNGEFDNVLLLINSLFIDNKSTNLEDLVNKTILNKGNFIFDNFFEKLKLEKTKINRRDFFDALKNCGFLKEEEFNSQNKITLDYKKFKMFSVGYLDHFFIMVVDTSKSYEEAIKDKSSIILIDSSNYIKDSGEDMPKIFRELFLEIETINPEYQKNDTCWANVIAAEEVIIKNNKLNTIEDLKENFKRKQENGISYLEQQIILFLATNFLTRTGKNEQEYTDIGDNFSIPYPKSSMFNKKKLLSKALIEEIKQVETEIIDQEKFEEKERNNKCLFVFNKEIDEDKEDNMNNANSHKRKSKQTLALDSGKRKKIFKSCNF